MIDLPEYFRAHINCPGVKLGTQSLNCLMYACNLLVISNLLEGLQQSLDVISHDSKVTARSSLVIVRLLQPW